jgi:ubiquinol-cytochrome c reductase cytochrome b subunit
VLKDAIACLAVLATILFFVVYKGAELNGPANPAEAYSAARPEWYFLFLFRFLKFEAIDKLGLAFGAIYVPGAIMTVIALMPIIGRWKMGHRFNIAFTFGLLLGAGYLTVLALREDAADVDYQAAVTEAHRDGERAAELAHQQGIPAQGALALLNQDPFTQGPRLFARACSSCHRYDGHDGTGRLVVITEMVDHQKIVKDSPPTAADLGHFGSREWTREVLVNYHELFAPLKNAPEGAGNRFLEGDMASWSTDSREALLDKKNEEGLKALVEFLYQQSGREDTGMVENPLVKTGQEIFTSGKLPSGDMLSMACTDCHGMKLAYQEEPLSEEQGAGAPTLTGYAGYNWLKGFINNPGHASYYGENNQMPAFETRLTAEQIDLLARWMVGDYEPTKLVIGKAH